jgi:glutathione S-transferase
MKLYSGPLSLFSRKVEIALYEKGLPFERVMVPFTQTVGYSPKNTDVLRINPKGQVPVLIDGDLEVYDSTLIIEYLDEAYPTVPLFPAAAKDRAQCRLLDVFADEVMLVPLRALMHRTGPRPADPQAWLALEAAAKDANLVLARYLTELDQRLAGAANFFGKFSAADIAVFMAVLFSQRLGGPSIKEHAALWQWYRNLSARPAFAKVLDEIKAADLALSSPVEGAYGQ